jgi:[acyl-carrier-protein] S-malonyltransferase
MPVIGYLFAGPQAAQPQMGRDLYNKVLSVRNSMDRADKAFAGDGFKVTKACFLGTPEDFYKPSISAPAMLALCFGIVEALKSKRVTPQMVAGYAWGEISALACMGALPFEDTLKFLKKRGEILEAAWAETPFHVASVIGLSDTELSEKFAPLPKKPELISVDSADSCMVAGDEGLLKKILPLLASKSVKISAIVPGYSWPHPSFKEAGLKVAEEAAKLKLEKTGAWELYSAVMPEPGRVTELRNFDAMQAGLCASFQSFKACAAAMRNDRLDTVVEIGPGQFLGNYTRRLDTGIRALATEDAKSLSFALKLAY